MASRSRVHWAGADEVRTFEAWPGVASGAGLTGGGGGATTTAAAPAPALGAGLFRDPPIALRPLRFSQVGQEWRPYPRSHCAGCGGALTWYGNGDAQSTTRALSRPDGAFGARLCECDAQADEVLSCEFRVAAGCAEDQNSLQKLDCKLLDRVLKLLCDGADESGAAARGLRALAASCRRGRELATAARWVPGLQCELFPHQVAALQRATQLENRRKFGRVCGGVMCDEAGLGKTVTALALIARSRSPAVPRIPIGARLVCAPLSDSSYYHLEAHILNASTTKSDARRKLLMAGTRERQERNQSRRYSARKRYDTARDPAAGYGGGRFTADRQPERIGPTCRCTLIVVPEELEQQWQNELSNKTTLRHKIVLQKAHVQSLKNHGLWNQEVVTDFPHPAEIEREQLDCVVTTFDRLGTRKGMRDGRSQRDGMEGMRDGLARVHWHRIIIDEGHELGGHNLGDMSRVLGAVLASATWVLSGTPDRNVHFAAADVGAMTAFLTPGVLGREAVIRTPKGLIGLPELHCKLERLPFTVEPQPGEPMDIERKLVRRFQLMSNADSKKKVERVRSSMPEELRLTESELSAATTGKATFVQQFSQQKHPSAKLSATNKTIIYSLYNAELYIAIRRLMACGWVDYGSPFASDWDTLEEYLKTDALLLGYSPETWPNLSQETQTWWQLSTTQGNDQRAAANTLGFSPENWPPVDIDAERWKTQRRKFAVVADDDRFSVGSRANIVRQQSLQDFKNRDDIQVLFMDAVATVGHDLCCVSDLICMEPIPQRDAWNQLVSRAYRMGSTDTKITVQTLIYAGGAEEAILRQCPWSNTTIPSAKHQPTARQLFSEDTQQQQDEVDKRGTKKPKVSTEMEATGVAAATHPPTEAELRTMSHGQLAKLATHEELVQLQLSKQEHMRRQPLVTSEAKAHADRSFTPSPRFVGPRWACSSSSERVG
eukprot:SAG31_NODE_237_length_19590_cov_13.149915_20_plen_947_part_00